MEIRPLRPSDYLTVISVIDNWWGGRQMADMLPRLYERFFAEVRARDCRLVRAVTAPINRNSIAFHQRMGFDIEPGDAEIDGIPVTAGYDGDGKDRVRFTKTLVA